MRLIAINRLTALEVWL